MEPMSELVHLLVSYTHRRIYGHMALLALLLAVGSTLVLLSGVPFSTTPTVHAATDCAAQTDVSEEECEALLAFYTDTGGANWRNNTGWNDTNTPCSWYGVTCTGKSVTSLDLSANELSGDIPPQLVNLTDLKMLNLTRNDLSGSIPPELGSLTDLEVLNLTLNDLSGSIPPELGSLTNLESFYLHGNEVSGSIPPELGDLDNLEVLNLNRNSLSESIPPELGNLDKLEVLDLAHNELSGSIPPELGNLTSLELLYLTHNDLSGSIPPELANLTGISVAYIGENNLDTNVTDQTLLDWLSTYSPDWSNQVDPGSLNDTTVYLPLISR